MIWISFQAEHKINQNSGICKNTASRYNLNIQAHHSQMEARILAKIISIHSFRGGTGKSNTSANIVATLAMQGKRVGVVDTDIQSPGIHVLFGLEEDEMGH